MAAALRGQFGKLKLTEAVKTSQFAFTLPDHELCTIGEKLRVPVTLHKPSVSREGHDRGCRVLDPHKIAKDDAKVTSIKGQGGLGIVHKERTYAVKVITAPRADPRDAYPTMKVTEGSLIGMRLKHQNIMKVYRMFLYSSQTSVASLTLHERSHTNLWNFMGSEDYKKSTKDFVIALEKDMFSGLRHLHAKGLIHRDIKPETVHVVRTEHRTRFIAKIGDLDLCTSAAAGVACGTRLYMAPETSVLDICSSASDIWSAALVLWEMAFAHKNKRVSEDSLSQHINMWEVVGTYPFQNNDHLALDSDEYASALAMSPKGGDMSVLESQCGGFEPGVVDILKKVFVLNPGSRPSAEQLLGTKRYSTAENRPHQVGRSRGPEKLPGAIVDCKAVDDMELVRVVEPTPYSNSHSDHFYDRKVWGQGVVNAVGNYYPGFFYFPSVYRPGDPSWMGELVVDQIQDLQAVIQPENSDLVNSIRYYTPKGGPATENTTVVEVNLRGVDGHMIRKLVRSIQDFTKNSLGMLPVLNWKVEVDGMVGGRVTLRYATTRLVSTSTMNLWAEENGQPIWVLLAKQGTKLLDALQEGGKNIPPAEDFCLPGLPHVCNVFPMDEPDTVGRLCVDVLLYLLLKKSQALSQVSEWNGMDAYKGECTRRTPPTNMADLVKWAVGMGGNHSLSLFGLKKASDKVAPKEALAGEGMKSLGSTQDHTLFHKDATMWKMLGEQTIVVSEPRPLWY